MKKNIIFSVVVLLILSGLVLQTIRLRRVINKNDALSDSLSKKNSELEKFKKAQMLGYNFDYVECMPIHERIINSGDSLNLRVLLCAGNLNYKSGYKEVFLTLGKSFDKNNNLADVYDTIWGKNWECECKIKTSGIGIDSIVGALHIPWNMNDSKDKYSVYTFITPYLKVDKSTFQTIEKFKKSNQ